MTRILYRDMPDAGLWRRIAAGFYDGLLIAALWFVLGFLLAIVQSVLHPVDYSGAIEPLVPASMAPYVVPPVLWTIAALFCGIFWVRGGQTLGMQTWRLRLVSTDDRALRWRDAWLRCAIATLSFLVFGLGYWWVLWRGHTWHDAVSRTRVVVLPKGA